MKKVAFSGHRLAKMGGYSPINPIKSYVLNELDKILNEIKPDMTISGMAIGFDSWAADLCKFKKIPFTAAVPFVGQENKWPEHSQAIYRSLLDQADDIVIICKGEYEPWKFQKRNEWMVDNSDIIIAAFDGSPSGTKNCIDYAKRKNKEVIIINPNKHEQNGKENKKTN